MNKIKIRRITAAVIAFFTIIVVLFTFIKGESNNIIGKWQIDPAEGGEGTVFYEFFKDSTGIKYRTYSTETAYGEEWFSYKLKSNQLMLDSHGSTRVYPCEISHHKMLLDNKLYNKKEGGTSSTAIYCISAVLIILAIRIAL